MSIDFADTLFQAIANRAELPEFDGARTLDEAYRLQHDVTRRRASGEIHSHVRCPQSKNLQAVDAWRFFLKQRLNACNRRGRAGGVHQPG